MQTQNGMRLSLGIMLGTLTLLIDVEPAWAVYGHWHRVARRTVVATSAASSSLESAQSSQQVAAVPAPAPAPAVNADAECLLPADPIVSRSPAILSTESRRGYPTVAISSDWRVGIRPSSPARSFSLSGQPSKRGSA